MSGSVYRWSPGWDIPTQSRRAGKRGSRYTNRDMKEGRKSGRRVFKPCQLYFYIISLFAFVYKNGFGGWENGV